jgi:hypothetical protein
MNKEQERACHDFSTHVIFFSTVAVRRNKYKVGVFIVMLTSAWRLARSTTCTAAVHVPYKHTSRFVTKVVIKVVITNAKFSTYRGREQETQHV